MRHYSFAEQANRDPQTKEWYDSSRKGIGPYFKNKAVASGLSHDERKAIMPDIIDIEANDREFRKNVENYFNDIYSEVPADGLELEIGLDNDKLPVVYYVKTSGDKETIHSSYPDIKDGDSIKVEYNKPLNPIDYVKYRHHREFPKLAQDQHEAESNPLMMFYIFDPTEEDKISGEITELEEKAGLVYFEVKDSPDKIRQILTLLGFNTRGMTKNKMLSTLKDITIAKKGVSYKQQMQALNKFIEVSEDKDLEIKFLIEELITAQYLERIGSRILDPESDDVIGTSMKEAVLFLKDKSNADVLARMKAKFEEFVKK